MEQSCFCGTYSIRRLRSSCHKLLFGVLAKFSYIELHTMAFIQLKLTHHPS